VHLRRHPCGPTPHQRINRSCHRRPECTRHPIPGRLDRGTPAKGATVTRARSTGRHRCLNADGNGAGGPDTVQASTESRQPCRATLTSSTRTPVRRQSTRRRSLRARREVPILRRTKCAGPARASLPGTTEPAAARPCATLPRRAAVRRRRPSPWPCPVPTGAGCSRPRSYVEVCTAFAAEGVQLGRRRQAPRRCVLGDLPQTARERVTRVADRSTGDVTGTARGASG
jgi:hypothetical protein